MTRDIFLARAADIFRRADTQDSELLVEMLQRFVMTEDAADAFNVADSIATDPRNVADHASAYLQITARGDLRKYAAGTLSGALHGQAFVAKWIVGADL